MRSVRPQLYLVRRPGALAFGCCLIAGSPWRLSATSDGAVPAGALSISTEPADASVYGNDDSQRSISGTATSTGFQPFTFERTFDSGVATLTVVANGSGFTGDTMTFMRQ